MPAFPDSSERDLPKVYFTRLVDTRLDLLLRLGTTVSYAIRLLLCSHRALRVIYVDRFIRGRQAHRDHHYRVLDRLHIDLICLPELNSVKRYMRPPFSPYFVDCVIPDDKRTACTVEELRVSVVGSVPVVISRNGVQMSLNELFERAL